MSNLSNSEAVFGNTDKAIIDFAKLDGKSEVSRLDFLQYVSEAYIGGTLNRVKRVSEKGKELDETVADYATHALNVWSAARAKVTGKALRPVKDSRKSELSTIFRATQGDAKIVERARKVLEDLANENSKFSVKTYDGIVAIARAGAAAHKADKGALSEDDMRAVFAPRESEPDAVKDMAAVIKRLKALAEKYPGDAAAYNAAAASLETAHANLVTLTNATAAREDHIAKSMALGATREQAEAFYNSIKQDAPDGGRVLKAVA